MKTDKNKQLSPYGEAAKKLIDSGSGKQNKLKSLLVVDKNKAKPKSTITQKVNKAHKFITHPKVVTALLIATIFCSVLFAVLNYGLRTSHQPKSLQLAGIGFTNKDQKGAQELLAAAAEAQKINIVINGTTYSFKPKEFGLKRDSSQLVEEAYKSPDPLITKLYAQQGETALLKTYVQRGHLVSAIETKLGNYKTSRDASVSFTNGSLVVNPSKPGMALDFNQLIVQLQNTDLSPSITLKANLSVREPEISTAVAEKAKIQAQSLIAPAYGVSGPGSTTRYASAAQKASWLSYVVNKTTGNLDVLIDPNAAKNTLNSIVKGVERPAKDRITLTLSDGTTNILDEGQSGVAIDQAGINEGLNQLTTSSFTHQGFILAITTSVSPQKERNLGTVDGGKFVLVDVADLKAYAINGNVVDRTMLVSTGKAATPTPRGHFKIQRKIRLTTMRGCNKAVGCWVVPNVPNVEYFTSEGHALHGTYWHNQFGKKNMSHGCVNLSQDDAAWLYDWTEVGNDVIVV